jgi:hypothetical protein
MKLKNLFVSLLFLLSFPLTVSADLTVLEGAGTSESPYLINNCDDWIVAAQNATNQYFELTTSIDCSAIDTPNLVIFKNAFEGNFDGNNNVITVSIDDNGIDDLSYLEGEETSLFGSFGLFRFFKNGVIANLGVAGQYNITSILEGGDYQYIDVGGMVGSMGYTATTPLLNNVFSTVDITTVDGSYVGGLVGYLNGGTIRNSYVGEIEVNSQTTVGGFIGLFDAGTIERSYTRASVNSTLTSTGGFVSAMTGGTIRNSYALGGTVTGVGNEAGGFVGVQSGGLIDTAFSNNTVTGADFVGGFIGQAIGGDIEDAYSSSSVTGADYVGGFVGSLGRSLGAPGNSEITRAYANGLVTGDETGGFAAKNYGGGTVADSYWNTDSTGQLTSAELATDLSDLEFKDSAFFVDWDFVEDWAVDSESNGGYPYFKEFENDLAGRDGVINITANSATLVGDIFNSIKTDSTYKFFVAKTSDEINFAAFDDNLVIDSALISPIFNIAVHTADLTGLECGTSYDFVFVPTSNFFGPIDYSGRRTFETSACPVVEEVRSSGGGSGSRAKPKSLTYEEEIEKAIEIELITKDPLAEVNKCEALTMMSRAFEWEVPTSPVESRFSDVPEWCQSVAEFAFKRGVVKGRESTLLGLDSPMSRYEMAVMIHRELTIQTFDFDQTNSASEFTDSLVSWAKVQVLDLANAEFVKGFADDSFGGQSPVIKQDFAVVLLRSM